MTNFTQSPASPSTASATMTPALILLGRDEAGKAHASRFDGLDSKAVRNAAAIMGMATLPVVGEELGAMAVKLPMGKLYESGRAFVPFVKGDFYEKLHDRLPKKDREALAETNALRRAAAKAAAAANAEPESFTLPDDWAKITVGNLILAYDSESEAWYEAYVVETKGADDLVLRWRDWPDLPNFVRNRNRTALLHPSYPINTAS